jgi:hypothetical protein
VNNSEARVQEVFGEAARLFAMKNASYQDSWRDQGWRGNVSRVLEKAKRVRSLLWRQSVLLNGSKEHPRETLMDIMNTCAFAIINMDDGVEWGEGVDAKEIMPSAATQLPYGYSVSLGDPYGVNTGGLTPPEGMSQKDWALSMGDAALLPRDVGEQTIVAPAVGDVPTPGEDSPVPRPQPTPRNQPKRPRGQGSGPRPVQDQPQQA